MDFAAIGGGFGSFIQGVAALALIFWLVATSSDELAEYERLTVEYRN